MDEPSLLRLLESLCGLGATDLLLKAGSPPKVRCKGVLEAIPDEPTLTRADVDDAALAMLGAAPALVLDGQRAVTYTVDGLGRFRVGAYRQRGSTAIVVRRTPDRVPTIDALGLPAQARLFAEAQQGLVLVVGQRHSGRRRTLASMLDHINHVRAGHIVAVEQRVELLHPDAMASVSQLEVGTDVPSFGDGVRAARFADADVVAISDVVDDDTATELLRAAEDGLVVLAGMDGPAGSTPSSASSACFHRATTTRSGWHCQACSSGRWRSGWRPRVAGHGRVPVVEVIVNSPEVTACLFDEQTLSGIDEIVERGGPLGMQSFATAAAELLMAGTIDLRGLLSVIDDWPRVHRALVDRAVLSR